MGQTVLVVGMATQDAMAHMKTDLRTVAAVDMVTETAAQEALREVIVSR